jgi:hypothetical protein
MGLAVRFASPSAIRLAQRMRSRRAARFLFTLRLLPVGTATFAVLGLCIPSYLRYEPGATSEEVGFAFIFVALLGTSLGMFSLIKAIGAGVATFKFKSKCRESGQEILLSDGTSPVLVIEENKPVLAMAGAIHPQIIVSRGVLHALSNEQLDAAIRHEMAHRRSADNFKRLLLLFAPEILPFTRAFSSLDHAWVKFSEFAADDCAVGDDVRRSLSLAAALVRVARMGAGPRLSPLCTALISDDSDCANCDLFVRVDRLLRARNAPKDRQNRVPALTGAAVVVAGLVVALITLMPSMLHSVHEVLEHLTH